MASVLRATPLRRFYKNDRTRSFTNPMRRWYYHYLLLGGLGLGAAYVVGTYELAKWEANRHGDASGRFVCSSGVRELLAMAPFNAMSNLVGQLAEPGPLPRAVHHKCIDLLLWFYGIDLGESKAVDFDSLQDFYVRQWPAGSRPVSSTAAVASPCDGEVLAVHEDITTTALVHVKGLTYGIQSLFRTTPTPVPAGYKRVAVVLHLRMQDHHHVIAPLKFTCQESIYVPGELLPTTAAGYHWVPGVLTTNERLVVFGSSAEPVPKTLSSKQQQVPFVALAMVGSTLTGRMKLAFDGRIRTNFLDPPDYAVYTKYNPSRQLERGSGVGTFFWGSSVVLMVDVPNGVQFQHKVGDLVKVGEALLA